MRRALVLALVALAGCTYHSRRVTPWLRTSLRVPPHPIFACAGSPKPIAKTERRVGRRWAQVSSSDEAIRLPGGRALFYDEDQLVIGDAAGQKTPLAPCGCGELRLTPDGRHLVSVGVRSWSEPGDDLATTVQRFDLAGRLVEERAAPLPTADLPRSYFTRFVGFSDGKPVIAAELQPDDLEDERRLCAAWRLDEQGWTALAPRLERARRCFEPRRFGALAGERMRGARD